MALSVVYEGIPAGSKNVDATELESASAVFEAGRICTLIKGVTKAAGTVYVGTSDLDPQADVPFGLIADYRDDVIANGKISVYFTQGLYRTDQTSGAIAKGDILSFDTDGKLKTTVAKDAKYVVGICTEAAGDDGFIEMYLNITGAVL